MGGSTRERLVDAANRRFYRDGFRNVGIDQMLSDVGITKTACYKHLESKDDLVLEVLGQQDRWFRETMTRLIREHGGESAFGQLRALIDVLHDLIESDEFRGRFFVNVAMDFPLPHDPAHIAAASNKAATEEIVQDLTHRAGADDPQALAQELCLILEGTYVTMLVTGKQANRSHRPPHRRTGHQEPHQD